MKFKKICNGNEIKQKQKNGFRCPSSGKLAPSQPQSILRVASSGFSGSTGTVVHYLAWPSKCVWIGLSV